MMNEDERAQAKAAKEKNQAELDSAVGPRLAPQVKVKVWDGPKRPESFPAKVRVTQFPDKELEVDEAEWNNLAGQGLLTDQHKE